MKKVGKISLILLATAMILILALCLYYFAVTSSVHLESEKLRLSAAAVNMYDDRGTAIPLKQSERESVEISDLPAYVAGAFVSVEDKRFYSHGGLDYKRIVKAQSLIHI
ncbi:MAG: transglycosylase domain-containing protein [Clostridiales bacterium]|nr:transglycosylase domain-containing protein [Clostridiales bacterium]